MAQEVALITGASRGIGAAIAVELARPGRTILVNYLKSNQAAQEVCRRIQAKGVLGAAMRADVADSPSVERMFHEIAETHKRLDILVLNAGIPFQYKRLAQVTLKDMEAQWRSQAQAAYLCCRQAVPLMTRQKSGKIVFILSSATVGMPPAFMLPYVSAKYALLGFAKALAAEVAGKGVQIHLVSPGMTETDFIKDFPRPIIEAAKEQSPLKRLERPEDTALLVGRLIDSQQQSGEMKNWVVCKT